MTGRPLALRHRVTLAFTALGLLLSLAFATAVLAITEDYEHVLAEEILRGQAEDYSLRLANHLPAQLPQTHRLTGYVGDAPLPYRSWSPGIHDDDSREGVHVGVFDTSAGRLFFVIDLGDIEILEDHLNLALAAVVVLGTALSGWLGLLLARRALAPVTRLAAAVDALPDRPAPTALAADASPDDLGRLADAIDRYQMRLVDADHREQAFFADASHELRTPVAVVKGAAELLRDDAADVPALTPRLDRLDRGVGELAELLEIMLRLARRQRSEPESLDVGTWLSDTLRGAIARFAPDTSILVDAPAGLRWLLPRHEATLVLRAIMRRLVTTGVSGQFRVDASALGLQISQVERLRSDHLRIVPADRADAAAAAGLVKRLAERHGWTIASLDAGTAIRWAPAAGDASHLANVASQPSGARQPRD